MGIAQMLLDAQRRPEEEARRLTETLSRAAHAAGPQASHDEIASAVKEAVVSMSRAITEEKIPVRDPGHGDQRFGDAPEELPFTDAAEHETPSLRATQRFLLDDGADAEDPEDPPEQHAQLSEPAQDSFEDPDPQDASPPWEEAPESSSPPARLFDPITGIAQRPAPPDEPDPDDDDGTEQFEVPDQREYSDEPFDAEQRAHDVDDEPADDAPDSEHTDHPTQYEAAPSEDERQGARDFDGSAPAPAPAIPSPLDGYAVPAWDEREEAFPVSEDPADDEQRREQAGPQESEADDSPGCDASDEADTAAVEDTVPSPRTTATAPPSEIPRVDRDAEPDWKARLKSRGSAAGQWLHKDRSKAKTRAMFVAAVLVSLTGAITVTSGRRGSPPVLPEAVIAGPSQSAAASASDEVNPDDQVLVPKQVSSSCGIDSDARAPFVPQPPKKMSRAWVCDRANGMDGNVLNIIFDRDVAVCSITVIPGWNYVAADGRDEWVRHRLTTSITWRMGGNVYPQNLTPVRTGVTKKFPCVITRVMSLTITATTSPTTGASKDSQSRISGGSTDELSKVDATTAISMIEIRGHPYAAEEGS